MLDEIPVSAVTLNELSRRVGLAKSNVMRYFESREGVLLNLLTRLAGEWLRKAEPRLQEEVPLDAELPVRLRAVASTLAGLFDEHAVLCDLLSAQASVLEHNVSEDVARQYKRTALEEIQGLATLIRHSIPELDERHAHDAANTTIALVGVLWTYTHPSPSVAAVYRSDPSLVIHQGFVQSLEHVLGIYFLGLTTAMAAGGPGGG